MSNAMLDKLMQRRGVIATITTTRLLKTRKDAPQVYKTSQFQCRVGVDYENMQSTIDGRANGTLPATNEGLPWGEWVEFPYLIGHKGELYFRCTKVNNNYKPTVSFECNGKTIPESSAREYALASEFREGQENTVFTIKVASIVDVA